MNITTFMWIQNPNTLKEDTFIVNGKMIGVSQEELRKKASDFLLLNVSPNLVEKIVIPQYNKKHGSKITMKSQLFEGTIYQSAFIEKKATNHPFNYFYWCSTFQLSNLHQLIIRDAAIIGTHVPQEEQAFIKKTTKDIIIYRALCSIIIFFCIICLFLLIF